MKISELATAAKVSSKTIRYYESIGLLTPPARTHSGYRHYQLDDIETLVFIRRCRELGISLDDIKQLAHVQNTPQASCDTVDKIIAEQLIKVQQAQKELAQLAATLTALATSCCQQHIADCQILHQLKTASL